MKYLILMAVIFFLFTTSCKNNKDESRQIEYMIFGQYHGFCGGKDCNKFFKIDCCQIFEVTSGVYPDFGLLLNGKFNKELDPRELDSVSFLIHRIPHVLFFETVKTIGSPDSHDQGGLYIEVKCVGNPVQFWYIDQDKGEIPSYVHTFVDDINKAIVLLK